MKKAIAIIGLCVAITGHGLAQTNRVSTNATIKAAAQKPKPFVMPDEITTLSGKTYQGVQLQTVSTDEIYIVYIDRQGIMNPENISLSDLPDEIKSHLKPDRKPVINFEADDFQTVTTTRRQNEMVKTSDGETYEVISWDGHDPAGINISYFIRGNFGGIYHKYLLFETLPKEIQDKYHYDPVSALTYEQSVREQQAAQEQADEEAAKRYAAFQNLQAAQQTADAMVELAKQEKRTADAADLQAKAAMIQATNTPQINVSEQQNNTAIIVQQQQQNNFGH